MVTGRMAEWGLGFAAYLTMETTCGFDVPFSMVVVFKLLTLFVVVMPIIDNNNRG